MVIIHRKFCRHQGRNSLDLLMHYNMGHGIAEGRWGVLFILALL